jgi:pimeloyl-ACP methyl ester carboxylesterase
MADDAAGVLRALGVASAHVAGFSGGSIIAQELALRHPQLVRSLVLQSTWPVMDPYLRRFAEPCAGWSEPPPASGPSSSGSSCSSTRPALTLAGGLDMTSRPEPCRAVAALIPAARFQLMREESPIRSAPAIAGDGPKWGEVRGLGDLCIWWMRFSPHPPPSGAARGDLAAPVRAGRRRGKSASRASTT